LVRRSEDASNHNRPDFLGHPVYVLHVFASSLDNLRTDLSQNLVNGKMKVN